MGDVFGSLEKALGAFSAWICAALAIAAHFAQPNIPTDHQWMASVAVWVFGLVAVAKVVEGAWKEGRRFLLRRRTRAAAAARAAKKDRDQKERQAAMLARLDHLNEHEVALVAQALIAGSQTVHGWIYWPAARALYQKGLLAPASGEGNRDHWPWTFPDHVWVGLQARKDTLLERAKALELSTRRR